MKNGDRWTRAAFILTLVIFAAIAVSAYVGMRGYLVNTRSVTLSRSVHMELDDLVSSLKDVQRGARGYLIARDTAFLQPYRAGAAALDGEFAALHRLTDSSLAERQEIETLRSMSDRLLAGAEEEVALTRRGAADSARAAEQQGLSKRAMDRISEIVIALQRQEETRLAERLSDAEGDFNGSVGVLVLGSCLNFVLIVGMYLIMQRQIRERRATAETLRLGEQRLQTVINSIREGITFSNAEGGFEVFSARMTDVTGYTREEANRAGDFSRLIYPDPLDHQRALDGVQRMIDEPGIHVSESTITTKSGVRRTLRLASQMLTHGGRRMFLTTYTDITAQKEMERALRDSEEKLRLIFEHARDGISIFEEAEDVTQRRLVDCNPLYAELAGRSREELLARGTTQGLAVNHMEVHSESIRGGKPFRGSFSWLRPDGGENIIEYTAVPIEMRGKKYTIGIDRDVTEARRAQELVRASQERYRQLFEASPIPLMIYDAGTLEILEVNPATVEHYGYTRDELLAMTVKDIRPEDDLPEFLKHLQSTGERVERTSTWRHRKKDGSIIRVEINSHAIEWQERRARLILVHDITELLRIEEELRIQKAHFQRLFESAPEGIALLDPTGIVHDVNRAFVHMFGRQREEMIGSNILEKTVPDGGREEARDALGAVMEGVTVHLEAERIRNDGSRFTASIVALPVEDVGGARTVYVLYRDITQKKRWDTEREGLIRELQKALADVKTLGGLLPICAWCKKIRDDQGYYHQIETFIAKHSDAKFTHGICPECRAKFDREAAAETRDGGRFPDQRAANPAGTPHTG
ncbi:MAG TPA: PAS domain S-box protein [Bacteroidota bacterium]|nr:PAS domain S-box protein [Bacteroidota bacterium]